MSKLLEILKTELEELHAEISDIKELQESAEERIKSDQEIVVECSTNIRAKNEEIGKIVRKIEAIEEDNKAAEISARAFLGSLDDDESKLNFASFCETLGIEIEIEADENAEADEEAEKGDQIIQVGA